ncbi:core histone H2A/H2B/H3/H4 family protein, putative [Babesia bigemina]|uniref:Core histone H2A/H2B/H3/H4 family protein, putative n=1 Tax=Babesia bigemina TaxID=5866 RepID=A0A061D479_BABBI|nr:core histone H2A/H2B/H3/H4 family protein, putative [Babesia bigemina]CDR93774.1 core histone H2A/H2B/H3/H4 family protein, putative [Babesia bigemina]|eukprot:XP_012765960.1 core histone H2A/H2B/H3/H4 family protein, putative [Babesia bigemina]
MASDSDVEGYSTPEEDATFDDVRPSRIPGVGSASRHFFGDDLVVVSSSSPSDSSVQEIEMESVGDEVYVVSPRPQSVTRSARSSSAVSLDLAPSRQTSIGSAIGAAALARENRVLDSDTTLGTSMVDGGRDSFASATSFPRDAESRGSVTGRSDRQPRVSVVGRPIDVGASSVRGSLHNARNTDGGSTSSASRRFATESRPSTSVAAPSQPDMSDAVTASLLAEARAAPVPKRPPIKPVAVLSPARIIAEFKRGSMSKQQAVESLIRYRMNKMLHKNSDRMYVDKDGDVRFVKGYDFGKSRDTRGRVIRRNGLTRIEREILAYQKSTHLLIPRAVFARIVRDIAQTWWRGPEPVKFTVEALSALQAATEDEITRLLEISTACSYHAKRITLRIDDMRLARFCRGRQEYEFFNIKR